MRLCLVSDTHRYRHELLMAAKATQPVAAILHAGDETSDAAWLAERIRDPIYTVAGNWDPVSVLTPYERTLTEFGPTLLLTHGHRVHVKRDLSALEARARVCGAEIVVFGHTHVPLLEVRNRRLFVNPGSLSTPRGRRERTFAVLEIANQENEFVVSASHWTAAGQVLSDTTVKMRVPKRPKT